MKPEHNTNSDLCVCCGQIVLEGRMVCLFCEINPIPIAPPAKAKPVKKFKKLFDFKGAQK